MIIGITGKSGSGKTTLTKLLSNVTGFPYVEIDSSCHIAIYNVCKFDSSYLSLFGLEKEFEEYGTIDTKKIGNIIFNDQKQYYHFISEVWDEAKSIIDAQIKANSNIILEYILLPKTHYWGICDRKILVTCEDHERKSRVLTRDNITLDYYNLREKASMEYIDIYFDYVYDTSKGVEKNGK